MRLVVLASLLLGVVACSGGGNEPTYTVEVSKDAVPQELVDQSWVVQFADQSKLGEYGSWKPLVVDRELRAAVERMPAGVAQARAHADAALLYRQAALLAGNAVFETYSKSPDETDPQGVHHLIAASQAMRGDFGSAKASLAKLDGVDDPTNPWRPALQGWVTAAGWPEALTGLPVELPPPTPGMWPAVDEGPHYSLPEQAGSTHSREMSDPLVLVALAMWHDAAAKAAAPDQAQQLATYQSRYILPVETSSGGVELELSWLFGSDYLVPADGPFLAEVLKTKSMATVDKYVGKSLLASMTKASVEGETIDAQKALDVVFNMRQALLESSKAAVGGEAQAHHRVLADMARAGTLRNLALVAEALEPKSGKEQGGLLRINAMENSLGAAACPVGLMSLGAWDTANRYPSRAQEIVHNQMKSVPSLAIARYGLDVLALRVGRERTGEGAGM